MCVVSSNYASVGEFPALLLPVGARQVLNLSPDGDLTELMSRHGCEGAAEHPHGGAGSRDDDDIFHGGPFR